MIFEYQNDIRIFVCNGEPTKKLKKVVKQTRKNVKSKDVLKDVARLPKTQNKKWEKQDSLAYKIMRDYDINRKHFGKLSHAIEVVLNEQK